MADRDSTLDADTVRKLFDYDPETGVVTRRVATQRTPIGAVVGTPDNHGHLVVHIAGRRYYLARIIWLWVTGIWPNGLVDHENRARADNRWANLRDVSYALNSQNRGLSTTKKYKLPLGVTRVKGAISKPFVAQIQASGRNVYLGSFGTPEEASAAYVAAKQNLHPGAVR